MLATLTRESNGAYTRKCGKLNCKTCTFISEKDYVTQWNTNSVFLAENLSDSHWSCCSSHVVYLIECAKCGVQYVGQTTQSLKARFGQHRRNIEKGIKDQYIYRHFQLPSHSLSDVTVRIIGSIFDKNKSDLIKLESYWIQLLNTAYPFGLNDKISGFGLISNTEFDSADYLPFFKIHPI